MAETVKKVDEDAQATPVAPEETKTDAPVVEEVSVKLSAGHVKRLKDVAGVEDTSSAGVHVFGHRLGRQFPGGHAPRE